MRCALHARGSKVNGEQEPQAQVDILRAFAESQGWEIVGSYVDRAGATNHGRKGRKEWAALLASAQQGELDVVLCTKYDRTFRSTEDAVTTLRVLNERGVATRSLSENWLAVTQPSGKLVFDILCAVAEFEKALVSRRTKEALAWRKVHGTRSGRPIGRPVGWRKHRAKEDRPVTTDTREILAKALLDGVDPGRRAMAISEFATRCPFEVLHWLVAVMNALFVCPQPGDLGLFFSQPEQGSGGQLVIWLSSMLEDMSDDVVLGVVAHEIAHAALDHPSEDWTKEELESNELISTWGFVREVAAAEAEAKKARA